MWVFRGEADGEPKPSAEGEISWMPISRIADLDLVEDIPTLLPKVLAMKLGDPPLWGKYLYDKAGNLTIQLA
jgi:hypothetical protein